MDKKLSRAVTVLDSLESYFQSLDEYLKQTDRVKYTEIEAGLAESRIIRKRFTAIKLDDDGMFQATHLHVSVRRLLQKMYTLLDFQLPVGEEISKTRAYRLTEVFNKITAVYRTYIRDVAAESSDVVATAAAAVTTKDPLELQSLWQKWPNSIDLYTKLQTQLLDLSYREKAAERTRMIFEILESDKRFILGEREWISPFLTFNCVPWSGTPLPVTREALLALLPDSETAGLITINREQAASVIHLLPTAMTWGPGITDGDIHRVLHPIAGDRWNWNIAVRDTAATQHYYIFESLGEDQWRVLVPWKYPRAAIPRDILVHKIKERAFGRPNAYHAEIETSLRHHLSRRVAIIAAEEARSSDVSLSVLRVTDLLLVEVKRLKGATLTRLESDTLDRIFESSVLEELSRHELRLLDAVLYWTDWSRRAFRRELNNAIEAEERETPFTKWDIVVESRVEKCIHSAVSTQLHKVDNVFQDLFNKQHKIDEVQTHTKNKRELE